MGKATWEGLRPDTDPIYEQTSIVLGPGSKPPSSESDEESSEEAEMTSEER